MNEHRVPWSEFSAGSAGRSTRSVTGEPGGEPNPAAWVSPGQGFPDHDDYPGCAPDERQDSRESRCGARCPLVTHLACTASNDAGGDHQ